VAQVPWGHQGLLMLSQQLLLLLVHQSRRAGSPRSEQHQVAQQYWADVLCCDARSWACCVVLRLGLIFLGA
jgi:hypothetical protein